MGPYCVIKQMFLYRPAAQRDRADDSDILYTEKHKLNSLRVELN